MIRTHTMTVEPFLTESGDRMYAPQCSCGWEWRPYYDQATAERVQCRVEAEEAEGRRHRAARLKLQKTA